LQQAIVLKNNQRHCIQILLSRVGVPQPVTPDYWSTIQESLPSSV